MITAPPALPDLLSLPEAAARLGVHLNTLHRLLARGDGPPVAWVDRRRRYFNPAAVDEFRAVYAPKPGPRGLPARIPLTAAGRGASVNRSGGLPESTYYRDTGCQYEPSCLSCTLPVCHYDQPVDRRRDQLRANAQRLARLIEGGQTLGQAADQMGISRRTAYRLRNVGGGPDVVPMVPAWPHSEGGRR